MANPKVGTDTSAGPGVKNPKDTYKSGMQPDHPTLRPRTNFKQRSRSGTAVPKPPELNLP